MTKSPWHTGVSILVAIACLVAGVGPARAEFEVSTVSGLHADCSRPVGANSPSGVTMIAWVVRDQGPMGDQNIVTTQLVPTLAGPPQAMPDPTYFGPGGLPALCWSREGFTLAMVSGEWVLIYQSDPAGHWDVENPEVLTGGPPSFVIDKLDLWGCPVDGAGAHVFLCVGGTRWQPEIEHRVSFASRSDAGWSPFEPVAVAGGAPGLPQMSHATGPYGPLPRVYYLADHEGQASLVYRTKQLETGWDGPFPVPGAGGFIPGPVGSEFDVADWGDGMRSVLGCGPQPTCPCNSIHYSQYDSVDGWQDPVDLTVSYGLAYDWPQSPNVSAAGNGPVHAFWYQAAIDSTLTFEHRTLEYWVQTDGGWVDAGDFLDGDMGEPSSPHVAMALQPGRSPVLAWTHRDTIDGVPRPQQIRIARHTELTPVSESNPPQASPLLGAQPNPFNPRLTLTFVLPLPARPNLPSTICAGTRSRSYRRSLTAGQHRVAWDGTDAGGRPLANGVYVARLEGPGYGVSRKVLLAR